MSNISPCDVKVGSKECSHLWRINNYSTVARAAGETVRSSKFSAADDDLNWRVEHTVQRDAGKTFVSLNLRPDCYDNLKKCESVFGNAEVYLMGIYEGSSPQRNKLGRIKSFFILHFDEQNCNCNVAEFSYDCVQEFVHENKLTILCNLTYCKKNKTVSISSSSSNNSNTVSISESRLSSDMERCFTEDHFKDVTISVKGKEYRAHKTILATRSSVFDKMLRVDMLESKKNHISITDVDHEPFEEMLHYMYAGKVKNLDESAFELLPLADKYDLEELRSRCEEVLVKELTTDNVARILILADTHRVGELKTHELRFIRENYESCKDLNDTKFWKNIIAASNAELLKEMMAAFCKK